MGGKLEFLCGYNLVPALVLDFGGVSLMGRASDVPFHKMLVGVMIFACHFKIVVKEQNTCSKMAKGKEGCNAAKDISF